jgi:hypothetical protein
MQSALPNPSNKTWRLVPFVFVSILIHSAILFVISLPTSKLTVVKARSMSVYLVVPPVLEHPSFQDEDQAVIVNNLPQLQASSNTQRNSSITHLNVPNTFDTPVSSTQPLLESATNIARDEGRKIEQNIAAQEKIRRNTPIGVMEQDIKQPEKEMRLANGMLKIITSAGEICFQPAPYFAHDTGVFSLPIRCP